MSATVTVELPVVESHVLAGNPLGDPAARVTPVLLPPGYADPANATRRYPVLFGLSGYAGRGLGMLNDDPWQGNLADRLTNLYAAGMPHALIVLPDAFTRYGGSQYLNSSATGRYEDYVVEELVAWVDASYRTIPAAEGRGLFGISSGGFGALTLGMRHPDAFAALACHSGDMAFELCYGKDFPAFCNALTRAGGVAAWWEQFQARGKKPGADFDTLSILAMASCYSPDPGAPLGIALPMDPYTCERIPAVWARWLEWDPIENVDRYAANLRRLRLVHIEAGSRDEYNLHFGARIFHRLLAARAIPHDYEEFDDGHRSLQYRYDVSLPKLARALLTA